MPRITTIAPPQPNQGQFYFMLALAFMLAFLLALLIVALYSTPQSISLQSPNGQPWHAIPRV